MGDKTVTNSKPLPMIDPDDTPLMHLTRMAADKGIIREFNWVEDEPGIAIDTQRSWGNCPKCCWM